MEAMTVSQVSRAYGVSTRMLRYYEQTGLIQSYHLGDYAYRMYDGKAQQSLRQILILRRLRIPLRQIGEILKKPDAVTAIEIFRRNICELEEEITALTAVKSVLCSFVDELRKTADVKVGLLFERDEEALAAIASLPLTSINFREDKTMETTKKESALEKLRDVRIITLPPATVAAAHVIGDNPEDQTNALMSRFVRESGLALQKPDLRHYGFNHPNPVDETGYHGYEMWVTIPEDLEVPAPLEKKRFSGGLYAAHMIPMGNFNEWEWLLQWVNESEKYEFAGDMKDQEHMCGLLEEHLNYLSHVQKGIVEPEDMQLDLLMPIRERNG